MKRVALGALLALSLAACSGSAGSSAGPSAVPTSTATATGAPAGATSVTLSDFKITPAAVTSGPAVSIAVTSDGPTPHNLTIRNADEEIVAATDDLRPGESDTIEAELAAGEYTTFCSLAGHESLGMRGTLTVAAQ